MKIKLLCVGKTVEKYLQTGIEQYRKRLLKYGKFSIEIIPELKNAAKLSTDEIKQREGEQILNRLKNTDMVWLFDENGTQNNSVEFSGFMQKQFLHARGSIVLVVGGAYGFSEPVYQRAQHKISISSMTFSHQMVRLLIVEQLYRGFTILNNEPYHHV